MSEMEQIKAVVAFMGGEIVHTGGDNWHIEFDHGETVTEIRTIADGSGLPTSWADDCGSWFYTKVYGSEEGEIDRQGTLREVLLEIYGPIEGEPLPDELKPLEG